MIAALNQQIGQQFGTLRGAIRLGLAYAEVAGRFAQTRRPRPGDVHRLVFVCHGNICRSAFAEAVARRAGYSTASFGLSTTSGQSAYPTVLSIAAEQGMDITGHRTTAVEDFRPEPGDYLLGMEVRHLRRLAASARVGDLPRGLLGSYARFPVPHLHDPYGLDHDYMKTCLARIEDAVSRLCRAFPNARAG
jgi:protein-tyrosine phosphatase